jgi:hypothetical protein
MFYYNMCYSSKMSFSFAFIGIVTTLYIYFYNNLKYKYVPMILLFYSGMEILQGTQYYIVNECNNPINKLLTEVAYLFVLLQPLMWNFFYYANSEKCEKNIFITAMTLSLSWIIVNLYTRLIYTKKNVVKNSYIINDSVCTKKNKGHLYWNWTASDIQDFNPTMLMYVLVWFIPALLTKKHRGTSMIITLTFLFAFFVSNYNNDLFVLSSLWCYFSVPIVLLIIYKNLM